MAKEEIDFSVLPSKKICGGCYDKKDIGCFYISKYVSSVTGRISFYATTNCKKCHGRKLGERRKNWTLMETVAYRLYQKNYYQKNKEIKL